MYRIREAGAGVCPQDASLVSQGNDRGLSHAGVTLTSRGGNRFKCETLTVIAPGKAVFSVSSEKGNTRRGGTPEALGKLGTRRGSRECRKAGAALAPVKSESGWVIWGVDQHSQCLWAAAGDHAGGGLTEISEMYSRRECSALWTA